MCNAFTDSSNNEIFTENKKSYIKLTQKLEMDYTKNNKIHMVEQPELPYFVL